LKASPLNNNDGSAFRQHGSTFRQRGYVIDCRGVEGRLST
jgi:hypothetical protein